MNKHFQSLDKLNYHINDHINIILKCTIETSGFGRLLLASPPDKRYPYIYPRDVSSAVQLFRRIAGSRHNYDAGPRVFELIQSMARFMKKVQSPQGDWGQRYSVNGENKSIYKQEDNVAHGIAIICNYLLTAYRLNKEIGELEEYLLSIDQALEYAHNHNYQKELNLFHSHTSIHESAIEEGYTCWVNFAYLYAFSLAEEVSRKMDRDRIISPFHLKLNQNFSYSVNELFMSGERYVRRIDPRGNMDMRPDFTLLSSFYFGFVNYPKALEKSVNFLEKQLCDPELGMIMRYLPFYDDFSIHVHAGNGPWIQYTAILAQFHFWNGNLKRGRQLLNLIDRYRNEEGGLPEHLSTCKRFENFMEKEWQTGIDFQKEFHQPILLENVEFDNILEETNNMARSYRETGEKCMFTDRESAEGGFIQFATLLMWSHVEYIRALMVRAKDWWRIR